MVFTNYLVPTAKYDILMHWIIISILHIFADNSDQSPPALKSLFNPNKMKLEDGGSCYSIVAAEQILETETTNTSFLNFVDTANSATTTERDSNNITEKRSFRSPNHRHLLQPISGCSEVESITLTTTDEDMKKNRTTPKKRPLIVELNWQ